MCIRIYNIIYTIMPAHQAPFFVFFELHRPEALTSMRQVSEEMGELTDELSKSGSQLLGRLLDGL